MIVLIQHFGLSLRLSPHSKTLQFLLDNLMLIFGSPAVFPLNLL